MSTLSTELTPQAERPSARPRIYADANVPAPLVSFMREKLGWDVLFVIEEEDLRRAPDLKHFRLAAQLRRTLITLDRDYLNDRRFPPAETSGVLVLHAPGERELFALVKRVSRLLFASDQASPSPLPIEGRKLHIQTDWRRDED